MDLGSSPQNAQNKRTESNLAKALKWARLALGQIAGLLFIEQNRAQQSSTSGTVVAAGGAITLDASIVLVDAISQPNTPAQQGNIRIKASASGGFPVGNLTPELFVGVNGGPLVSQWKWAQFVAPAAGSQESFSTDFTMHTAGLPGQTIVAHWSTTAGDQALTLGNGVAASTAAALTIEQAV